MNETTFFALSIVVLLTPILEEKTRWSAVVCAVGAALFFYITQ